MSDVLLLDIDLSSHISIGLFILAIDLQFNVPGEIIPQKFQQTASFRHVLSRNEAGK